MTMYWKANGERDLIRENAEEWNQEMALEAERARRKRKPTREEIEFSVWIFNLPFRAIGWLLALPFRYGYGKQYLWALLFLFFVAPVTFFVGAFVLGIHAHPQAFLAFWQTYVIQHPGAASWTWAIRGFTDLCRW
ncbi:hypothetical protein A6M27_06030 [Acidithiobacillus thiooxidans]|uniref:Uncharacterized protein n=2 Tax=Acidithiobacillus TaxID=119977 RepID=A0A1C2J3N7_ACITH|nr:MULTISPECIES: hypothetical protein [Acidithiobacillus]MBU2749226.1 hypothetical protein [Acidithiobacillus montserratensis]OCX73010.1 hypothetical protein A6M23_08635 [Acidithiobacillus thiooxidans]OCX75519.1 hypothetical protein A6P07_04175 [Acidithiobacillus thiooxidans]OCX78294.1 hypothetical protein A6O24_04800 [Acidithiobacillus thiooxidans]OCX81844.1 hypothetical protein A6P08_13225 [Acidithiobacillus thiooxidans]